MSTTPAEQTSVHTVLGMTCDHCARSVTEEVSEIPSVDDVRVDLASGRLEVTGRDVPDAAIAAAVAEAGYEVSA
jgi:copper chaperone CopZ